MSEIGAHLWNPDPPWRCGVKVCAVPKSETMALSFRGVDLPISSVWFWYASIFYFTIPSSVYLFFLIFYVFILIDSCNRSARYRSLLPEFIYCRILLEYIHRPMRACAHTHTHTLFLHIHVGSNEIKKRLFT